MKHALFSLIGIADVSQCHRRTHLPGGRPTRWHITAKSSRICGTRERELWEWASSAEARAGESEDVRTAMLKSNYRLDAAAHPGPGTAMRGDGLAVGRGGTGDDVSGAGRGWG